MSLADVHRYTTFVISCSCASVGLVVVTLAVYVAVPDPGVVLTVDGVTVTLWLVARVIPVAVRSSMSAKRGHTGDSCSALDL